MWHDLIIETITFCLGNWTNIIKVNTHIVVCMLDNRSRRQVQAT